MDSKQRLWVGTVETGLSLFDRAHDRFINFYPHPEDSSPIERRIVFTIIEDHSGNLWLATAPAGVVRVEIPATTGSDDLDSLARGMHFRRVPLGTPLNTAYDICKRNDGKILVASDSGMFILDPATSELSRAHLTDPLGRRLDSLTLYCVLQGSDGNVWAGGTTEGLFRVDWKNRKVANYRHRDEDSLSIKADEIEDIAADRRGNLWIATINGIDLFSPAAGHCIPYLTFYSPPEGVKGMALSVDRTGTLWVGCASGAYRLSPRSQLFQHFSLRRPDGYPRSFDSVERSPDGNPWCFSEGKLFQLDIRTRRILKTIDVTGGEKPQLYTSNRTGSLRDKRGNLWYGANNLGLYNVDVSTGRVKNYRYESRLGGINRVRSIVQGSGDTLWIAAVEHGLMKFDPASGRFLKTQFVPAANVMKDHDGKIWIATEADGLVIYDPVAGTTNRVYHDPSNPGSLSHNTTVLTYEDPSGRIWVGVGGNEVHLWNPATNSFTRYPNPAFNDASEAYPIGSDKMGRLWVWYSHGGLSILDPSSGVFTNYDVSEGVCGFVYDMESMDNGRVLLAGTAGLNIVSPDSIDAHRAPAALVITRMAINDEPAVPASLLKGSGSLHLSHTQDVLEFEFAALDIDAPGLVQYQYQLEGLDKDWVKPKDRRYVRYTAVPPGNYVFKVRAASSRGEWPDQEIAFAISIAPPWWRTVWSYAVYAFLFAGLLYAGYRVRLRQVRLEQQVDLGQFKAEHLADVDRLKSRFFANISHEFRTPLTLILGPIQKWRDRTDEEDEKKDLSMAERNAHRLLSLINQLLDLSKLEAGAMKLRASRMNIVPLVRGIAYSFESSAGMSGITLHVGVEQEKVEVYCDRDMVEKILSNLLSNAFKFTHEGGSVSVSLRAERSLPAFESSDGQAGNLITGEEIVPLFGSALERDPERRTSSSRQVGTPRNDVVREGSILLTVADTGIGIPPDQLDRVFDRFYQVDTSQTREHEGSGLGLALVKDLVELHHWTIQVQSEVGKGTTFTVRLPLGRDHLKDDEIVEAPESVEPTILEAEGALVDKARGGAEEEAEPEQAKGGKPIVLVVEDNADMRAFIKDYLVPAYQVTGARDGAEGIEKAEEIIPDLIISDVMMPKKDGYEVCRTLKLDEKTSHIPIILLTAKAASENKIEGLETGADDYLIKPFEPMELLARVKNLIELRKKLRQKFSERVPLRPGEIAVSSVDEAFLGKVGAAIEQRIGDENFSVEELGRLVGMSRSQLHRKLTALTGMATEDFVRYLRLHRAMDLLRRNAATVSEIAYMVGFSSPAYFTKRFHQQFGTTPSAVLGPESHQSS